jgi:hypothetical protein
LSALPAAVVGFSPRRKASRLDCDWVCAWRTAEAACFLDPLCPACDNAAAFGFAGSVLEQADIPASADKEQLNIKLLKNFIFIFTSLLFLRA